MNFQHPVGGKELKKKKRKNNNTTTTTILNNSNVVDGQRARKNGKKEWQE